jgi:NADH-quinone oxidoreductase subunit N
VDLFHGLTSAQYGLGLLPEITLTATAVVVILADLFIERKEVLAVISLIGLAVAAFFSLALWGGNPVDFFGSRFAVDGYALFFKLLILGIAFLVILASHDYASKIARYRGEFFALILTSALGMMVMAAGTELITIYIGLELAGISLYALAGFLKDAKSSEAALKYLVLGAVASAVLLYGMALVFGFTGETSFSGISGFLQQKIGNGLASQPALLAGVVLMAAGFGFKIAAVPFHMWVPDVYEGSPTPITAYLSVASKAAGFAVILRVFTTAFLQPDTLGNTWGILFAILAAVSMTLGNVAAIPQVNIKRMLGYSSIAQAGYIMVGLAAAGLSWIYVGDHPSSGPIQIIWQVSQDPQSSLLFFLAGYAFTNMAAFTAIIAITKKIDSDLITDFAGMGKRAPALAAALTLALISLTGIPPAVGFMGKFYVFSSAVPQGLLWLVIIAVINSVISAYYYLRVVKVMWFNEPASLEKVSSSFALRLALGIASLGILLFGLLPGWLMETTRQAVSALLR